MSRAILVLRIWLAFACFFNLAVVSTYYGMTGILGSKGTDYGILVSSILLFLSYLYSIWGKTSFVGNKYIHAFLMLIPAMVLIGCSSYLVHLQITMADFYNKYMQGNQAISYNPFTCDYYGYEGSGFGLCFLMQSYNFAPIITGIFVIIEVLVTLLRGPLHPSKTEH
ncbi:hypothetical protein EC957_006778 [Mortierella hygrophila]|uniref:Uncharacterized protein n=1 Tax=Mortierella hygrophila TaxID=979708 RepID=A0A9P6EYQ6_9FUNG|nr:hypothetical protein EC957_006778 [Mortierella hygrophila]